MSLNTETNFIGHDGRECGEHRTVGPHRAWCFDCTEWCYPEAPCVRCEAPKVEGARDRWKARAEQAEEQVAAIRTLITEDYGEDYGDEDVPAAVERLMRHLSEHEANVQCILQAKNAAIERLQAERDTPPGHLFGGGR